MALLTRSRRVPITEFRNDYYQTRLEHQDAFHTPPSTAASTTPTAPPDPPRAPVVPPLRPQDVDVRGGVAAPPVNPAIWRDSNMAKLHEAEANMSQGERLRKENERVCAETRRLTSAHQQEVERRLRDRREDVVFWRQELADRYTTLDKDATDLKVLRDRLTKALKEYEEPLRVALECIEIRRGRVGVEDVEDEAATALRQEVDEIRECRTALQRALHDTLQQVRRVLSCRYHVERDVTDKGAAVAVEEVTSELGSARGGSLEVRPKQALDPSPVPVDSWREVSESLLARADQEHRLAMQVLSVAEDLLVGVGRQLATRWEATNHALVARVDASRNAKTQLEEKHAEVVQEERALERSLQEVEEEVEAKREPLALAQARLDARMARPNMERTRDEVEAALLSEVEELERSLRRLGFSVDHTKDQLLDLRRIKDALEHDINLKAKTVLLDEVKVLSLREKVKIETY
ncbi:tektin-1-like [Oratosquilla oratoria]|uniref:tektin-1-like n=1 Tax=Oratosquilla oratoria TaxID=337810 RepID=UPI003F762238